MFDWGWADAYRRHGRRYYPKWVVAVPFTPVPGPRLLAPDAATRRALLEYAIDRVRDGGHFSSLHVLFPMPPEAAEGEAMGMIRRAGLQFHWTNPGYRDFADFLATFTHDKRKKVKQERRKLAESGVTFERIRGPAITSGDWEFFYRRYERTYREHHSTPYLDLEFFRRIGAALPDNILLVVGSAADAGSARRSVSTMARRSGVGIGYDGVRVGLHFEACYYQSIEFCIEQRLAGSKAAHRHPQAGAGLPVETHSLHAIGDPGFAAAIADYCARARRHCAHRRRTGRSRAVQAPGFEPLNADLLHGPFRPPLRQSIAFHAQVRRAAGKGGSGGASLLREPAGATDQELARAHAAAYIAAVASGTLDAAPSDASAFHGRRKWWSVRALRGRHPRGLPFRARPWLRHQPSRRHAPRAPQFRRRFLRLQ